MKESRSPTRNIAYTLVITMRFPPVGARYCDVPVIRFVSRERERKVQQLTDGMNFF